MQPGTQVGELDLVIQAPAYTPLDQGRPHGARGSSSPASRLGARALDASGIALLVVAWQAAPSLGWVDAQFFPPPSAALRDGLVLLKSGALFLHVGASLARTLIGFSVAAACALPVGFLLSGFFPRATRFLRALFGLFSQIHAFSLFPLFVLFFGIGELAKFAVIFWSCFWPLLNGTLAGVDGVDRSLIKAARSLSCDRWTLMRDVLFPAALPTIFTGVRLGATVAFLMLIAAEMIGAQTGLGWLVHNSQINYIIPRLYFAAAIIALLGIGLEHALDLAEARFLGWKPPPQRL